MKDGLLLVDKHAGCTSHDIVQQARRLVGQRKIGHCGTLDPSATGLLVLTLGRATRLTRFLIQAPKVYEGRIRFGAETDTYDAAGETVKEGDTSSLTQAAIEQAMASLNGTIDQVPPRYSAKKIKGQKYYELARKGEEVPQEAKTVTVYEFAPLEGPGGTLEGDEISFRLACASGTYARALAHDVGQIVGCGAHLSQLRRTKVGSFEVDNAETLDLLHQRRQELEEAADGDGTGVEGTDWLGKSWIPFDEIRLPFSEITTDAQQEQRIHQGQTVLVRGLEAEEGDWVKLINSRRRFIAVGSVVERIGNRDVGVVQPRVVFH